MEIFLHEKQSVIDADNHRFQVVSAGRRFGKSFYAAYRLFEAASHTHKERTDGSVVDIRSEVVYYVGPTFKQGLETLGPTFKITADLFMKAGSLNSRSSLCH